MSATDIRDEFIARVVRGKRFVDIGGLWMIKGEKLTVAARSGAAELTMVDITPKGDQAWQGLAAHLRSNGVQSYETISADVHHLTVKPFDVVHSSGILYHLPNPMAYLAKMRTLTREYAVITSAITAEFVENKYGQYHVPPSGAIFVPALNDAERTILAGYWSQFGDVLGITKPFPYDLHYFDPPWWWLPTKEAFKKMCQISGFEIVDEGYFWGNNAYTLMLR